NQALVSKPLTRAFLLDVRTCDLNASHATRWLSPQAFVGIHSALRWPNAGDHFPVERTRIFAGRVIANFLVAESASTKLGSIRVGRAARGGQALWLFTPAFYERLDNLFVHGLADLIDAEACWPLARRVLDKRLEEFS